MATITSDSSHTQSLLKLAENGSEEAFRNLIERHLPLIRSTVRKRLRPQLRSRMDQSDIVQETQQHTFQSLNDFLARRPMSFRLWLLKTAHERILMAERAHLGAAKRSIDRELPLPDASSIQLAARFKAVDPANEVCSRERAAIVRRCLAQLGENDREVLLLRCFNGLTNAEVATVLHLKQETSKKRFTRALMRLRTLLEESGLGNSES